VDALRQRRPPSRCDIGVLYGPSGVGKTFTAIDSPITSPWAKPGMGGASSNPQCTTSGLEVARGLRHRMVAYAKHMQSAGRMLGG
jgi:hypothetical protein